MAVTYEPTEAKVLIHFAKKTETFTEVDPDVTDTALVGFYQLIRELYDDNTESSSKVVTYKMKGA